MKAFALRLAGSLLIFAAILGIVISVSGIVFVWSLEPRIAGDLSRSIDLFDRTLSATSALLFAVDGSLQQVGKDVNLASASLGDVAAAMETTSTMTDAMATLIGVDFTRSLLEMQRSLVSVRNSAGLIDQTLRLLSFVPGLGSGYRRDLPLEDSVVEVQKSLVALPASLAEVQEALKQTSRNFKTLQYDVDNLALTVGDIQASLSGAQQVVSDYQEIIAEARSSLDQARTRLPLYLKAAAWLVTVLLLWLLIAQISLFMQGWNMLQPPPGAAQEPG